jgi:hypothetical protein
MTRPNLGWLLATLLGILVPPGRAVAQTDYRNLDDDRPTSVEDAYPIERWAFELIAPWRYERTRDGTSLHSFIPELAYGLFPNAHVGLKLPIAGESAGSDRTWGVSGFRVFGLYNFNTDGMRWPALSLRADASFPAGDLGGAGSRVAIKAIMTRSFGRQRVRLNGSFGFGAGPEAAAVEPLPRWSAGAAVDHSFIRQSILLVGEITAKQVSSGDATEAHVTIGARYQVAPTIVLDLGMARRLSDEGPDFAVTVGLSHAFAIAGLMPKPHRPTEGRLP